MKLWELLTPRVQVNELLDKAANWSWRRQEDRTWVAKFDIEDSSYWVYLDGHDGGRVNLTFTDGQNNDEITGGGNAFQVFATLKQIVDGFLADRQPESISFSANEPSRARLYQRFADKITRETHGRLSKTSAGSVEYFRIHFDYDEDEEDLHEEGKIIPGVNTTVDVQPGETQRQAAKFGNTLDAKSRPPLLRGSYGDDSVRFSANQGDPFYGSDGTRLRDERR